MFKATWTAVMLPLIFKTMARCATGSAQFNKSQTVRRSNAAMISALDGQRVDRLVPHYDLVGTWEGADPNRAYAGLVPMIGGVERFDLALLTNDLLVENIPTFPKGDEVVFLTPSDAFHTKCRELLNGAASYEAWFNAIVAAFPSGFTIEVVRYPARNKRGGTWQNAILGGKL